MLTKSRDHKDLAKSIGSGFPLNDYKNLEKNRNIARGVIFYNCLDISGILLEIQTL